MKKVLISFFILTFLANAEPYIIKVKFSEIRLVLIDEPFILIDNSAFIDGFNRRELATFPVALPRVTPKLPVLGEVERVIIDPIWWPTKPTRNYYKAVRNMELPEIIRPGDPRNAMGKAVIKIKFLSGDINNAVVIHGTNDLSSIGKRISRGCIRMKNDDILKLIELIKGKKTRVVFDK